MALMGTLQDAFTTKDTTRWTWGAGAAVDSGRLKLTGGYLDPLDERQLAPALLSGEVQSVAAYDLRGSFLRAEVPQPFTGVSGVAQVGVYTSNPRSGNAALWRVGADYINGGVATQAVLRVAGVETIVSTQAYNAQTHRWLRLREAAGVLYWDRSADGLAWTQQASASAGPLATSAVRAFLAALYQSPGDAGTVALFDSLNTATAPVEQAPDPVTITGNPADPHLAVDVIPDNLTSSFTLDVSQLDGNDVLAWSDADPGAWQNIVCDVTGVQYRRGASRLLGILTQTEAGTCTITLSDTSHAFDPLTNRDVIHKGTPLRLRAWGYGTNGQRWDAVLFTGEVDGLGVRYLKDDAPAVTVTGVDLVGPLTAWESEGNPVPGVGAGDTLLQRVQRTLVEVARPGLVSPDSDPEYAATLAPTPLAKPWAELSDAVEAELGRLWVDSQGRLVVRSRGSRLVGPVRGTLSDVHGQAPLGVHCCVQDAAVLYGPENMANRVMGQRRKLTTESSDVTPARVRLDDESSQARYGVGAVERTTLELQTDDQVGAWAQQLMLTHMVPELRVDSVVPLPSPVDLDSALNAWPAVLQTDLGDRWVFQYHPTVGPQVMRGLGVLGIEVEATPEGWSVQWATEDAPIPGRENPSGWVTLDLSQLDGTDVLAPYAARL